jgi:hypothetical protein
MKALVILTAAALVSGCLFARYTAKWPYRGPMVQVVNPTNDYVLLSARDGYGRTLPMGTVAPQSRTCRTWPFIDERGWLLTESPSDQVESEMFHPWAFHGWRWTIGAQFETAEVCGT